VFSLVLSHLDSMGLRFVPNQTDHPVRTERTNNYAGRARVSTGILTKQEKLQLGDKMLTFAASPRWIPQTLRAPSCLWRLALSRAMSQHNININGLSHNPT
jgi:hypothetical protein